MTKLRLFALIAILISGIFFSIPSFNSRFIELTGSLFQSKLDTEFWNFGLQYLGIELMGLSILLSIFFIRPSLKWIAVPTVVLLFFITLFQYSVNIPIHDDYWTILDFSNQYFFTNNSSEKFSLLFSIWGESRLMTSKIVIIILHFLSDEVNIKYLILVANCCLPVVLFIFYKSISSEKLRIEKILIIALLLFHFGFYNAVVWATVALEYQLTILFVMLSLFLISKKSIAARVACVLCALLAALSFGNGLLIFPLAMLYFIIEKKWRLFFAWLFMAGTLTVFYFIDFPAWEAQTIFFSLPEYFIYSCCLLGTMFQYKYQLYLPFMAGLSVWILLAVITVKKYYRKNFFIYAIILFVVLSSLMAAYFRLNLGLQESISNRHGIFSALVIIASLIAFFEISKEKRQEKYIPLFLCSGIIVHLLAGVFFFPEVPVRKQKLETFIADLKNNKPYRPAGPIQEAHESILKKSRENKIYFP